MAFMVIDQSKASSYPYISRQWLAIHKIVLAANYTRSINHTKSGNIVNTVFECFHFLCGIVPKLMVIFEPSLICNTGEEKFSLLLSIAS